MWTSFGLRPLHIASLSHSPQFYLYVLKIIVFFRSWWLPVFMYLKLLFAFVHDDCLYYYILKLVLLQDLMQILIYDLRMSDPVRIKDHM